MVGPWPFTKVTTMFENGWSLEHSLLLTNACTFIIANIMAYLYWRCSISEQELWDERAVWKRRTEHYSIQSKQYFDWITTQPGGWELFNTWLNREPKHQEVILLPHVEYTEIEDSDPWQSKDLAATEDRPASVRSVKDLTARLETAFAATRRDRR